MYLEHFGLSEAPFRITPHTEFFFAGANRGATLEALIYAITHDEGIVKVSGEVGSGKTMLCRVLMERLPASVVIVYLANPSLSREDIVFAIADELGLELASDTRASAAIKLLQNRLIDLHATGRQVVVLIDEAHAMPLETLEEVRLLSNLETTQHKLLQLVLFGQPELDDVLARPDMRQLKERITHHFQLEPLRRDDIAQYVDFRMRTAGYRGPEVFSPNAIKLISSASQGLTRRINILAEKSLLAAYAEEIHQITPKQVDAAIRDAQYEGSRAGLHRWIPPVTAIAIVATVAGAIAWLWQDGNPPVTAPASAQSSSPPIASVAPPVQPPQFQSPSAREPIPETPPSTGAPQRVAVTDVAAESAAVAKRLNPDAQVRILETRQWINSTAGNHWFIQLSVTGGEQANDAQLYLAKADRLLQPEKAGIYVASNGRIQRIGIIHGDYPSRQAAVQAIEKLPAELRLSKPFPRQVSWLK